MPNQKRRREDRIISKCLFPAAGYGTRFLPATKATPKEMLPILTKPLIQYGIEEALEAGIHTMAIVTGRGKRAIEDHFDISYELENQIHGTAKEHLLDDIVSLRQACTFSYTREDGVLSQMLSIYQKYQCSIIAIEEVPPAQTSRYGIIAGEPLAGEEGLYRVDDMVEKPDPQDAPSTMAIIGRYILTPDIFDILRETPPGRGGEIQITDALLTQAKAGNVLALKFKGRRFDCGCVDGFVEATNYFYQHTTPSTKEGL